MDAPSGTSVERADPLNHRARSRSAPRWAVLFLLFGSLLLLSSSYGSGGMHVSNWLAVPAEGRTFRGLDVVTPPGSPSRYLTWSERTAAGWDVFLLNASLSSGPVGVSQSPNVTSRAPKVGCSNFFASVPRVHLLWEEVSAGGASEVLYRCSEDYGVTFTGSPAQLSSGSGTATGHELFVSEGGRACAVWREDVAGLSQIVFRVRPEGDAAFHAPIIVSATASGDTICQGCVTEMYGDRIAVAWTGTAGGEGTIHLALSADGGSTFAPPVEIHRALADFPRRVGILGSTTNSSGSLDPLHLSWNEVDSPGSPSRSRVFYMNSEDGGTTFLAPVRCTAGASLEGITGVALGRTSYFQDWEASVVFDGVIPAGRREIFFVHIQLPYPFTTGELSRVAMEGGYGYDREALGVGYDFHSPAGRGPYAWLDDTGIWLGEIEHGFYDFGVGFSGCY
jgi:hypothetical protein